MKQNFRFTHAKLLLSTLCPQAHTEMQVRTLMFLSVLKQNANDSHR